MAAPQQLTIDDPRVTDLLRRQRHPLIAQLARHMVGRGCRWHGLSSVANTFAAILALCRKGRSHGSLPMAKTENLHSKATVKNHLGIIGELRDEDGYPELVIRDGKLYLPHFHRSTRAMALAEAEYRRLDERDAMYQRKRYSARTGAKFSDAPHRTHRRVPSEASCDFSERTKSPVSEIDKPTDKELGSEIRAAAEPVWGQKQPQQEPARTDEATPAQAQEAPDDAGSLAVRGSEPSATTLAMFAPPASVQARLDAGVAEEKPDDARDTTRRELGYRAPETVPGYTPRKELGAQAMLKEIGLNRDIIARHKLTEAELELGLVKALRKGPFATNMAGLTVFCALQIRAGRFTPGGIVSAARATRRPRPAAGGRSSSPRHTLQHWASHQGAASGLASSSCVAAPPF